MVMQDWDKQKREPLKAFELFTEFRDLGFERSIENIERLHPELNGEIERYAEKWNWIDRANSYDALITSKEVGTLNIKLATSLELLLDTIENKILSNDEIEGMKIEALVKLAALYSKSIPDILNMKRLLEDNEKEFDVGNNHLFEKLRSNTEIIDRLTELLCDLGISK